MLEAVYENDAKALEALGASLPEFEKWMAELDGAHAKVGFPYGEGQLATTTGLECWIMFFEDGFSPEDAIEEDLSNE